MIAKGTKLGPRPSVAGENNPNWKGGRYVEGHYWMVKAPEHPRANKWGYVFEHILVLEEKLDRYLEAEEITHHKDGDGFNNSPDNLEAVTRSWHARHHCIVDKVMSAKTHCPKGHSYDEINTYVNPKGSRVCRACKRLRGQGAF
jgi:hypothetical protein